MAVKVKCPICEKMKDKEDVVKHRNRYYCPDCLEKQKESSKKNTDGWDNLYNYICDLTGKKPTGKMFKQLAEFRKEPYNYTNEGIRLTLYYFHELLGNPIKEDTLGIIPYVYEEAKKQYINNIEIHQHNLEAEMQHKVKKVKVKPTTIRLEKQLINFEELEVLDE